ncbi:undecaprenyl-phosphate glucose phosphotransferase [Zavarzinia aquatilis]|uniref:undecaprenyl-phosphate glucose phosphotransferase n=1 Tax=Zavarzinia aquatilis TaxID=2211142 RepID=UPI00140405D2|nr:undecaprenyl-phosphate glucose phosphotransferase [Zavarzinia aquatilis]
MINRLVRLGDLAAIAIAFIAVGVTWRGPGLGFNMLQFGLAGLLFLVLFVRLMEASNSYRVERYRNPLSSILRPALMTAIALPVTGIVVGIYRPEVFDLGAEMLRWLGWAVVALAANRFIAKFLVAKAFRDGLLRRRVAIVGVTEKTDTIIESLRSDDQRHTYEILGIYDDRGPDRRAESVQGVPVIGKVEDLRKAVSASSVDVVILALPWVAMTRIDGMLERLQGFAADLLVPLESHDLRTGFASTVTIAGMRSLCMAHRPLKGSQGVLKAVEDKVVAVIGLTLTAPILLGAAIAIRLTSPGPILFRQRRVGFNNQTFDVFKFRTMTVDPNDDGTRGTPKDNPRITRVGAFLRRSSIDELPQLLNVLKGDMSVVGPRPHVPNMLVGNNTYLEAVRQYAFRCRVKPGVTGLAQINGARGGIHTVEKARKAVEFDIAYIENWSLWLDIKIMAKTVIVGLFGKDVF